MLEDIRFLFRSPGKRLKFLLFALAVLMGVSFCSNNWDRWRRRFPRAINRDWTIRIVAQAPNLHHPTAIACAPDGRIFVGEDWSERDGYAGQAVSRVMCVHPSGRITVFADQLFCVFGICYLDGKVFVNHAPKLSVFRDHNGVGRDRVDLFDYTSPRADGTVLTGSRTHIPGNLRAGMDGFIYMAVGDVGIYGTTDKNGHRVDLRGGGVVRFRPDGSDLEVFSRGTRNHPDLALNSEDEIFTYDNTDDGNGWWTRVTHMVDGGYYGYPWDYRPRQPYTLWMITDFGTGSATAAIAYNEDGLPARFRDQIVFGDFGRSELFGLRAARAGASFDVSTGWTLGADGFASALGVEYSPIGIAVAPDGGGFYLTDWGTSNANEASPAGRLLALKFRGTNLSAPRPSWYVAAASGQPFQASTAELVHGLCHPAQCVRLVAQRRLAERGPAVEPPVVELLAAEHAPAPARWSAIWTLDAIDGGARSRTNIIAALADRDASVRRQAARQLGSRRAPEALRPLLRCVCDPELSVGFCAATALGRIGDEEAIPALQELLATKDLFLRYSAFTALNRIGHRSPTSWPRIVAGLNSLNERVREGTSFALRETYEEPLVRELVKLFTDGAASPAARVYVVQTLGELGKQPRAWDGSWWNALPGLHPVNMPRPAHSESWVGTDGALRCILDALVAREPEVRLAAAQSLKHLNEAATIPRLAERFRVEPELPVAKAMLETLIDLKSPQVAALLLEYFHELAIAPRAISPRLAGLVEPMFRAAETIGGADIVSALESVEGLRGELLAAQIFILGRLQSPSSIPFVNRRLTDADPNVVAAAVQARVGIGGAQTGANLLPLLDDPRVAVRREALAYIRGWPSTDRIPWLLRAFSRPELRDEAALALADQPDSRALDAYAYGLASTNADSVSKILLAVSHLPSEALAILERDKRVESLPSETLLRFYRIRRRFVPETCEALGPFAQEAAPDITRLNAQMRLQDYAGRPATWRRLNVGRLTGRMNLADAFPDLHSRTNLIVFLRVSGIHAIAQRKYYLELPCERVADVLINGRPNAEREVGKTNVFVATLGGGTNRVLVRVTQPPSTTDFFLGYARDPTAPNAPPESDPRETYLRFALRHAGDPVNGDRLFHRVQAPSCGRCHSVDRTPSLGPSLLGVGTKLNRAQLIEAVLYPSRQILNGYRPLIVETQAGAVETGFVCEESATELKLVDASGTTNRFSVAAIKARRVSDFSLMPEGLEKALSLSEFADLISFLEQLKNRPEARVGAKSGL